MPTLTVLVLSCRRLHYLRRTVAAMRSHLAEVEPDLSTTWACFDDGSSAEERGELAELDFDLLMLPRENLGQGPALNLLLSAVRTPYFLLLEDDWEVVNPERVAFLREAVAILESDPRIGQVKLDALHHLAFADRRVYDGPFRAGPRGVDFFVMDPRRPWGGFCCPPAVTRTAAIRAVGDFDEAAPRKRWWAESEFSARFAQRYVTVKSPAMLVFRHIGDEPCPAWEPLADGAPQPVAV